MSAIHGVEGLIKWIKRDEWRSDFEAVFDRHVGPACRSAGVELGELADVIGDHEMTVLWGCAFEILCLRAPASGTSRTSISSDGAGRRAPGAGLHRGAADLRDEPLRSQRRRGRRKLPGARPRARRRASAGVRALRHPQSFSMGQDCCPGRHRSRQDADLGAVLPFSHPLAEEALASIERVRKKARAEAGNLAKSLGWNVDEIDFAAVTGLEEVLASSAFMFSNLWLNDALGRSLNPTLPQIENTDGDPLQFVTVHFPLISEAKLSAIRAALDDLPSFRKESDGFWNWVEAKAPLRKAVKRRSTGAQTFGATMDDSAIVLGTIELGTKTVTLSVNSEARATRGRAMLEPVLAGLARAPLVEQQSIEQMMASSREHSEQDILRLPPDEERSIVHQVLTDHYRKTLDEPIPALGNQTPRWQSRL